MSHVAGLHELIVRRVYRLNTALRTSAQFGTADPATVICVKTHPSTPPVALYLLAASIGLAIVSLVFVVANARAGLVSLTLGASIGLGFATNVMAMSFRRLWDRRRS